MSLFTGLAPTKKTPHTHNVKWSAGRDEDDSRSLIVGVILAAIIWPLLVFLLWLASRHLGSSSDSSHKYVRAKPVFNIQMSPDEFLMPRKPTPPPPKFVETNPDAPENMPDNTTNFAARNQQAAQEKPNPNAKGDRAATEGKKDFESNQVVSGRLTPPTEAPPPEPPPTPEVAQALAQAEANARKAQTPLPGFEKREGANPEGFGMNNAKPAENPTNVDEKVEGMKDAPMTIGNMSPSQQRIDPRKPQPRQHVEQQHVRPAIFAENRVGSSNIGPASVDARWSNYGAYLQRLIDSVQLQFERMNDESRIMPPTGTVVSVKFRLDKEGAVTEIINADSTGGKQAETICVTSITSRAP